MVNWKKTITGAGTTSTEMFAGDVLNSVVQYHNDVDLAAGDSSGVAKIATETIFDNEKLKLSDAGENNTVTFSVPEYLENKTVTFPVTMPTSDELVLKNTTQIIAGKDIDGAANTISINATINTITDTATAAGDLLRSNGSKFTKLARGSANQVLTVNTGGTDIAWAAPQGAAVDIAYASSFAYIIFKDASDSNKIKARNTTTGAIQYNNTAAQDTFNSVLTAMNAAGGGMALVKSGTYNIGARITPKNNTGLIGEHRQSTILNNTTNATDNSIFYYNTPNPPSNVVLSHFTLDSLSFHWNNSGETQAPWYSENTEYLTFNNCHFKSFANPSVAKIMVYLASKAGLVTNTYARITNNIFEGPTAGQDQLGGGHYNSCLIANNTFIGDKSGTGIGQAIGCTRADGSRWIGNHFFNTGNIFGFEGDIVQNNVIADNVGIASGFIKLADVGNSTVNQSFRNVVTNNIQMYGNAGIRDGYGNDDIITNNLIWRTKSMGIKGTFNRCTIANNHITETNYDVFSITVGGQSLRDGGIVLVNNTAWTGQKGNKIFGNTFYRQNTTPTFTIPAGYFDDAHAATYGRTGGILIDTNFDLTEAHDNIWVGTIAANEYIQNFGTNTRTRHNVGYDDGNDVFLNQANTFTQPQTIYPNSSSPLIVGRDQNSGNFAMFFRQDNSAGTPVDMASLQVDTTDFTAGSEDAEFRIRMIRAGAMQTALYIKSTQLWLTGAGADSSLILDRTGLTANRTFTFPDANGQITTDLATQTVTNKTVNATNNTITDTSTAAGDIMASNGTKFVRKARGSALQVLRTNSAGTDIEYASLDSERVGKSTASGNGSTTVFNIAHGLGSNPTYAFVDCSSHAIARTFTTTSTNIVVTFVSAPSSGTNNVIIYWRVVA